jgi:hypothetical protein
VLQVGSGGACSIRDIKDISVQPILGGLLLTLLGIFVWSVMGQSRRGVLCVATRGCCAVVV